jgi:hypothetical protein
LREKLSLAAISVALIARAIVSSFDQVYKFICYKKIKNQQEENLINAGCSIFCAKRTGAAAQKSFGGEPAHRDLQWRQHVVFALVLAWG